MYSEEDHAGTQLIKHAGIFQRSISCMNIAEAVAEFYFRRNRYKGQVKIEADTYFSTKIILFQFYQIIRISGFGIAGQINIVFHTGQHIHFKIVDAVGVELEVKRKRSNIALNDFGLNRFFEQLAAA